MTLAHPHARLRACAGWGFEAAASGTAGPATYGTTTVQRQKAQRRSRPCPLYRTNVGATVSTKDDPTSCVHQAQAMSTNVYIESQPDGSHRCRGNAHFRR